MTADCLPAEIMTAIEVARYLHCSKAHVYNAATERSTTSRPCRRSRLGGGARRTALESWIMNERARQ